ncbi:GNAT family N-acetyltransferase [Halobacillus mangrovi]|uniref:GNAT family N-acetyltransferase n=1 Tax=Halobacillus mangrovi TaxID=402384 RepID=UPI003D96513F
MRIILETLSESDAKALYKFEMENRAFFEKWVPIRGEEYYKWEVYKTIHQSLLEEQFQGKSYFYLIKGEDEVILGRVNLIDVEASSKTGHLGYRIGEAYSGKGLVSKALGLLLEKVRELGVNHIEAKTTTSNIASRRILEKNGFTQTATKERNFEMNGESIAFVYYSWNSTNNR